MSNLLIGIELLIANSQGKTTIKYRKYKIGWAKIAKYSRLE